MTRRLCLWLLVCLGVWLSTAVATAEQESEASSPAKVRRFALVIGANRGRPNDAELAYAHRDAERVAELMRRLGRIHQEDLVMLQQPTAQAVERVIAELARRVTSADVPVVLYVYYSGHADATALRMGETTLALARLNDLLAAVPARVRVLILDACRSGDVTRTKGGKPAKPFDIEASDELATRGTAVIRSSAAGEDAQESERLRGGIFTHHLLTGLAGAADESGDARVTLTEAYQYAYAETLRSTTEAPVVQHPTYAFDLEGKNALVVTELTGEHGYGQLRLVAPGHYLVFREDGAGDVAAELEVSASVKLALAPGTYLVRRRHDDAAYEVLAKVVAERRTSIDPERMRRVPYARTVRKGLGSEAIVAGSVTGDFAVGGPLLSGLGPGIFAAVGMRFDFEPITLRGRLRYGRYAAENRQLSLSQNMLGGDITLLKLFDFDPFAPGLGMRIGVDWIEQRFDTAGVAPSRTAWAPRGGPTLHLDYNPVAQLHLSLAGGVDIYLLEAQTGDTTELTTPVVPYAMLGLGAYAF